MCFREVSVVERAMGVFIREVCVLERYVYWIGVCELKRFVYWSDVDIRGMSLLKMYVFERHVHQRDVWVLERCVYCRRCVY